MSHDKNRLQRHIFALSEEKHDWTLACAEWVFSAEICSDSYCPCGKKITHECHIANGLNGNETFVGNVCIGHFENDSMHIELETAVKERARAGKVICPECDRVVAKNIGNRTMHANCEKVVNERQAAEEKRAKAAKLRAEITQRNEFIGRLSAHCSGWEANFLDSIRQFTSLSEKQDIYMQKIATRLRSRGIAV